MEILLWSPFLMPMRLGGSTVKSLFFFNVLCRNLENRENTILGYNKGWKWIKYVPEWHETIFNNFSWVLHQKGICLFRGRVCGPFSKVINIFACVQIDRELVRLRTLIGLNKFSTHITSSKSLKKFHARHFDGPSSKNEHFWRFKDFYKQNYLL